MLKKKTKKNSAHLFNENMNRAGNFYDRNKLECLSIAFASVLIRDQWPVLQKYDDHK
jgi:hypothetical protein